MKNQRLLMDISTLLLLRHERSHVANLILPSYARHAKDKRCKKPQRLLRVGHSFSFSFLFEFSLCLFALRQRAWLNEISQPLVVSSLNLETQKDHNPEV